MSDKKFPLNESFTYLKKSYDSLNNQQSSSEKAPALYPAVNNINNNSGTNNNSGN